MTEIYRPIPAEEVTAFWSPERTARVATRAAEILAENHALSDIRKSRKVTQQQMAQRLGGKQVYISRLEKRSDAKISTLRSYIKALGGDLQLIVTFPEGTTMSIKDLRVERD